MNEPNGQLLPDWSPEQKAAIFEEMKKTFTADDLYGYVEDTDIKIPMAQVMAKAEALLKQLDAQR